MRVNLGAEPPSLDWLATTDSTSFDVVHNLMTGLTQYRNDLSCAPAVASSWEISEDGKHYLFHLRKDVRWSDGKPVTAYDFEYAWRRLLIPETGALYAYFLYDIENALELNTGKIKDPAALGVKALSDHLLEVKLKKPAAYFIYLTAFCPTYPQRRDIIEKYGNRWTEPKNIVTNGPFLLKHWEHEYKIVLEANPEYFEGKPAIDRIKMFMIPEQATAFALYENNQLDFIDNRSFSTPDVERCRISPEYHNIPLMRNNYIGFNVDKEPFGDARVRLAIAHAIDRSIFPRILQRGERPQSSWIPPGLLGYAEDSGPEYNPEHARKLLAKAGFPGGNGFPEVDLLYPNRADARLVVEAIQAELKENLNIRVNLINQEWKVYLTTLRENPPPVYRGSWGADFPDPETFMNLWTRFNGNNHTNWDDPEYDRLVGNASAEQNPEKRANLYRQADSFLCKQKAPIVATFLSTQNVMVKPWVKGMEFNALDLQFFKEVSIEKNYRK